MMDPPLAASPSSVTSPDLHVPSPLTLIREDTEAGQRADARLTKKSRLSTLLALPKQFRSSQSLSQRPSQNSSSSLLQQTATDIPDDFTPINLDSSALAGEGADEYTDRYEWAILYENQRGITIFSIPYYSSLSLLPSDPSPFTLPNTSLKRSEQPPITLDTYPLPDGNWRWVSRCWMIDMRTDTGEVQHDGFEYNWFFRRHRWRAQIGSFNAGGWVRRRRWVRLMMRPGKLRTEASDPFAPSTAPSLAPSTTNNKRLSMTSSLPSALTNWTGSNITWNDIDPNEVWLDDVETSWEHCRRLIKTLGRDGRVLELWRLWLGIYPPELQANLQVPGQRRNKQWTEDEQPMPSELGADNTILREQISIAPRELVRGVLRKHGQNMLRLFVFPESRAVFLQILGQAKVLPEMNIGLGLGLGASEVDFWSYVNELAEDPESNAVLHSGKQGVE